MAFKRGSPSDNSPRHQKGAVLVTVCRAMLLWWNKTEGYFVTAYNGLSLNGETRLNQSFVESALERERSTTGA